MIITSARWSRKAISDQIQAPDCGQARKKHAYQCSFSQLNVGQAASCIVSSLPAVQPHFSLAVAGLFAWRDRKARDADESTGYVMPRTLLLNLSSLMPSTPLELRAMLGG